VAEGPGPVEADAIETLPNMAHIFTGIDLAGTLSALASLGECRRDSGLEGVKRKSSLNREVVRFRSS
jgi:hypothetical protein